MHLRFDVNTEVYNGNHMLLIRRAEEAWRQISREAVEISPVLAKYLTNFSVSCTHPGYETPRVEYHISLCMPFATSSAVLKNLKGKTGFRSLSVKDIADAFLRGSDKKSGMVEFQQSRLGQAFQWGIDACRSGLKERTTAVGELVELGLFTFRN